MRKTAGSDLATLLARWRRERGLSQEQLAVRAGCTRQYVTQLERGERRRPSRELALRLAHALHLHGDDRRAFLTASGHPETEPEPLPVSGTVAARAETLLNGLPFPGILHDSLWTVQHANVPAMRLFAGTGRALEPGLSLLELVFDPVYRRHFPVWESWARTMLAQFKRDSQPWRRDAAFHGLLARLRPQPDFVRLWRHVDAAAAAVPVMAIAFTQPPYGTLHLEVVRMQFLNTPELWGSVFLPADEAAARLFQAAREDRLP
ncbi:helix-turn-helix domain-containing protein [Deinococcus sp. YIM 77859]|uniref:MmyB family transcriptional regulator n=1 Tax=Deinococcus sp. YIM 77859 TaxID=1540221 RepID=UPI00054E702D|nr:helix-turn-helix domain-containing protein [Deinococcus sp. YIM 77859]